MPRKCAVSVDDAVEVIKNFKEHFSDGELPIWSAEVWEEMSKALDGKWTRDCVYTNVREDRRLILSMACEQLSIDVPTAQDQNKNCTVESVIFNEGCSDDDSLSKSNSGLNNNLETFDVILTEEDWNDIKPPAVITPEMPKPTLKKGVWTNVISIALWKQYRLPCAFVFKRADVILVGEELIYTIKIEGKCKSKPCGNTFSGFAEKKPGSDGLIIKVKTRDNRSENHEFVKRPFNGKRRHEAQNELKTEGCAVWKKRQARENMQPGDIEPPFIPSGDVLRQARMEGIDVGLGLKPSDGRDIIRTIEEMSLTPAYQSLITRTASKPFSVFYSSPAQLHAYKEYCRLNRLSSVICVDSTGTVVKKLQRNNKTMSGHIFLYTIVINFDKTTIAVNQMLSEQHDMPFITYWLSDWLRNGAPKPKQVVCDSSRALLSALSRAFNDMSIKNYVSVCFGLERNDDRIIQPPPTRIRIDVAHFIHMICRWKCWKSFALCEIKDFFIRCIALMVECQTISDFENAFELTCIVALQSREDSEINHLQGRTVKEVRKKLEDWIAKREISITKYVKTNEDTDERESEDKHEFEVDEDETRTAIADWINNLVAKAGQTQCPGVDINAFYCPAFVTSFTVIAKEFPLWTSVGILDTTEHATSSYVESYFNDIKTRVFRQSKLPIRADKFLIQHARDIAGANNIFLSNMIRFNSNRNALNTEPNNIQTDISCDVKVPANENKILEDSDFMSIENWRGKAEVPDNYTFPDISVQDDRKLIHTELSSGPPSPIQLENGLNDNINSSVSPCADHSYNHVEDLNNSNGPTDELQNVSYSDFLMGLNNEVTSSAISAPNEPPNAAPTKESAVRSLKRTKTSKFFRAYPEIRLKNTLTTGTKKPILLPNGNLCGPVIIDKRAYFVKNKCAFDSLVHVLMVGMIENVHYSAYVEESTNFTLKFVHNLLQHGVTRQILLDRAIILKSFCKSSALKCTGTRVLSYEIDATQSIAITVNKTLATEPSVYNTEKCSTCNGRVDSSTLLLPNHKTIGKGGFNHLEMALEFWSPVYNVKCRGTCSGKYTWLRDPNIHVLIELDIRCNVELTAGLTCALEQLPTTLQLQREEGTKCQYRLVGVVAYSMGHYVSYCLRSTGNWQLYNDLTKNISTCKPNIEMEPHLIIYIRTPEET